jgi:16S rRNA (cytidine1402-2'-O)-methyltransferase
MQRNSPGQLFVVATPIGNLEDVTLRALRVLRECDLVACEDTRQTQKLLHHYEIRKRVLSYHEHNEQQRAAELVALLEQGAQIALVSDAGTPGISDPGQRIVALCRARGILVTPLPGPSAVIAALAASGMGGQKFLFAGFLPARTGERQRALRALAGIACPLAFYEAPHRLVESLCDMRVVLGNRMAFVARELTKLHEELASGSLAELTEQFSERAPRGEITIVVSPQLAEGAQPPEAPDTKASLLERVETLVREKDWDEKAALKQVARELGIPRRDAYKHLLAEKQRRRD